MSRRTRPGIAGALTLICLWQLAGPLRAASPAEEVASRFDAFFRQRVTTENVTGAAFVIASRTGVVAVGTVGYTDTSQARRIDENTVFRVASISKTFAAGLAGMLVNEGHFSWDDPVVDFLPDFHINGDSSQVHIRHLLGQSTGLMPHAFDNLIEDGVPLEQIRKKFGELSYLCTPGTCYSYQNSIFSLIEPVMEKTTERSYANLLEERIFRPLGMRNASVGYEPFVSNPNHALPHVMSRGRWKTVPVKPNYYSVAPAAGINASARDMGQWLVAQMGGQPAVLAPAVIDTLTEPRVKTTGEAHRKYWHGFLSEAHYGLGWRIYRLGEHEIAYHSGWVSGYRADIAWSQEENIGIAVLMNVEGSSINELTTTFWRMAFEQLPQVAGTARGRRSSPPVAGSR